MKKMLQKISILMLSAILLCSALPVRVDASYEIPGSCRAQADDGAVYTVKTLDYDYDNNSYLSLRDMAMVFAGTDKAFSLEITSNAVSLRLGNAYTPVGVENSPWKTGGNPDIPLQQNNFTVNDERVIYYTLITRLPSGHYDCFMMAADLAMILDVDIKVSAAGAVEIHTREPFSISPTELEQDGYFYGVNGVLVGDATTGEVYYRYQADTPYPIASTSKLMTCLLTMDAIYEGRISYEKPIVISNAAQALSCSGDGVISMKAGEQITVQDLLLGALLPSSNECALCLAEAIAGSEEAFVQMMNQKALDLGLFQAIFFNSHGLPFYTEEPVPSKCQNRMSADDMFRLVSYLLKVYPQITEITSLKEADLKYAGRKVRNTNPMLYNLPGVTGLKTGTTNKAKACLVTSLTVDDGGMEHDLVVIVFGAEDSIERGRVSGLLARYALQVFHTGVENSQIGTSAQTTQNLPTHAEAAVKWILQTAKRDCTGPGAVIE